MNVFEYTFTFLAIVAIGLCFIVFLYMAFDILNDHFYIRSKIKYLIRKYTDRTLVVLPTIEQGVTAHLKKYEIEFYKNRRYLYSVSYQDIGWHRAMFEDGPWDVIEDVYKYRKNKLLKTLFK